MINIKLVVIGDSSVGKTSLRTKVRVLPLLLSVPYVLTIFKVYIWTLCQWIQGYHRRRLHYENDTSPSH